MLLKQKLKWTFLFIPFLVTQAFAFSIFPWDSRPVAALSLGPVWEDDAGQSQTFFMAPGIEKTFKASHPSRTLLEGELFVAGQQDWHNHFLTQLGLAFAATTNAKLSGEIWDDADPQFNNYTYKYYINHTVIAVKGVLLFDNIYTLIPWISVRLGLGFNDAHAYDNFPICEAVKMPNFASHTETAFSYAIGIGVQEPINANWQAGIGYEFADWGKSRLGSAAGQTMGHGLSLDHLYTNGLLLNITYLA